MKKVISVLAVIVCFYSCQQDDEPTPAEVITSSYLPMAVGNYWVYQNYFSRRGEDFFTASWEMDSIYISKDTLINGITFYQFDTYRGSQSGNQPAIFESSAFYADSARHLINPLGKILFSEDNFTDTLYRKSDVIENDTLTWISWKMDKSNQTVTVPAGTFNDVLNFKGTVIVKPEITPIANPRYINNYFAKNVGKVFYSSFYVGSGDEIEMRLLRYKINE